MFMVNKIYSYRGVQLNVYVERETYQFLKDVSMKRGKSSSSIVNQLLREFQKKELNNSKIKIDSTGVNEKRNGDLEQNFDKTSPRPINNQTRGVEND